ncbi:hypothetical protein CRE_05815 [Caenorhabditis remanei]|uniref:RNA-directed DNA polymerase n=1 Tax=Caenorhabditis remanei TaxID=31234 RepID=E3MNH1_CAERE|nr:hypothetical protein CRE_05815 [Caenorhabditis remanei]
MCNGRHRICDYAWLHSHVTKLYRNPSICTAPKVIIDRQREQQIQRDLRAERRRIQRLEAFDERRNIGDEEVVEVQPFIFPPFFQNQLPAPQVPPPAPQQQRHQVVQRMEEQQQQQHQGGRPTLRDAPRYDGKDSFASFIRSLNDFLNAHLYGEEEGRRMLPFLLTDSARDAWETIPQDVRDGAWNDLLDVLRDRIHTEDRQLVARAELSTLVQGGRTVEAFYRLCKEVANKAYPGEPMRPARDAILTTCFMNGLKDDIRIHVQRSMPQNPEAALQTAKREEALRNVSNADSITAAINKLSDQVARLDVKPTEVNYIQGGNHNRGYNGNHGYHGFRGNNNYQGHHGFQGRGGRGFHNNHNGNRGGNRGNRGNRGWQNRGFRGGQSRGGGRINAIFDPCETSEDFDRVVNNVSGIGLKSSLLFIACLCALFVPSSCWTNVKPMPFYDCHAPSGQALIVPPKPVECKRQESINVRRGTVSMSILNQTMEETRAFKCRIEVYSQCVNSAIWIPIYNMSFIHMEAPTELECQEAVEEKTWRGQTLRKVKKGHYVSDTEYMWPATGFSVSSCNEARKITVEEGSVAQLNDGTLIMSLMSNPQNKCQMEDGTCQSSQATMIWKAAKKRSDCETIHIGSFPATMGDNVLIVDHMESAFPIDPEFTPLSMKRCFDIKTVSSNGVTFFEFAEEEAETPEDVEELVEIETTSSGAAGELLNLKPPKDVRARRSAVNESEPEKEEIAGVSSVGSESHINFMKKSYDGAENIRRNLTMAAINHKIQYVSNKIDQNSRDNFNRLVDAICHTRNRQLRIWRMFLDLDPQAAMRVLLHRDDIIATFKGRDVVQVSQCQKVIVHKIKEDRKEGLSCTAKTAALTTDNKVVYIQPGSIEVEHSSETTDCRFITNYIWQDHHGNWKETNQTRNVTKIEEGSMPTYEARQLIFTAGDIYAGVKDSSFPMMLAMSFGASIRSLQYQHQQEILRSMTFGSKDGSRTLNSIGSTGEYLFNNTVNIVGDVTSFFTGMYFIYGCIVVGVLLVLGVIGFFAIKFYFCKNIIANTLKINAIEDEDEADKINAVEIEGPVANIPRPGNGRYTLPPLFMYVPIIIPLICSATASQVSSAIPYVHISIGDKGISALWDSGASISYVNRSTANHLAYSLKRTRIRNAKTANGSSFKFLGCFEAPVRIADVIIEHEFLVAEDDCCPGNALIGIDFMKSLDRRGIRTWLRPAMQKLQIGTVMIDLVGPQRKPFELTNVVMEMINADDIMLKPGQEQLLKIANGADIEADQAVLLKSKPEGNLLFEKTVFHPLDSRETTIRVKNNSNRTIQLQAGDVIGKGAIVQLKNLSKPGLPDEPAEANWEERILETNGTKFMDKIDWTGSELNAGMKELLKKIFKKCRHAFFNEDGDIGLFKGGIEHSIVIRKDMPFPKSRTYRVALGTQDEVEKQVQEMILLDIIEESTSTFISPIVLVRKKDGTYRFTTDFRLLNAVTVKQNYQIPLISDIVDLASDGTFFTNLDLIQGFFQIPLRKEDRPLTAFATPTGTYQYKRMPMGLCGAPHTFQTAVRQLQKKTKAKLFCYLDDLLIVSNTLEQHMKDIEEVLQNIAEIGFKVKIEKCKFAQPEVTFLGLLVGRNGVKPNPAKVKSIKEFPVPKTPTGVRAFLGMTNYFRKFIRQFAELAAPLHDLTKKDQQFVWEEKHQESFDQLKAALCCTPVLQAPRAGFPFVIESDASSIAVGALLLQTGEDGELHPIAYDSRKLTTTERKYPPIETEALALAFAVKAFRTYILGSSVTAIVDHRPLTSLMHRRDLIGRLAKYQIILQEMDLTIIYRPGKLNSVCDALSRYIGNEVKECREKPSKKSEEVHNVEDSSESIDQGVIKKIQEETPWIAEISKKLEQMDLNSLERYRKENGVVYVKNQKGDMVILVPREKDVISDIMKRYHQTAHLGAHLGAEKTEASIGRRFYWNNITRDIRNFVRKCEACQRRKINPHAETKEPMGHLELLGRPWERVHADICGPWPVTKDGNRYVFTIKDDFTKYTLAIPIEKQDAATMAKIFVETIVLKFGAPKILLTDNGTNFKSDLFEEMLRTMKIQHNLTAPYHKSANGTVERAHRTIEEVLSSFVNSTQTDWDQKLPFVMFAINSAPHAITKCSPHQALFGHELPTPEDVNLGIPLPSYLDVEDFQSQLRAHLKDLHEGIKEKLKIHQKKAEEQYDRTHRIAERKIEIGDKIFVRRNEPKNKLAPRLHGPFHVVEVSQFNVSYQDGKKKKIANKNDVRLAESMEDDATTTSDMDEMEAAPMDEDSRKKNVNDAPTKEMEDSRKKNVNDAPTKEMKDSMKKNVSDAPTKERMESMKESYTDAPTMDSMNKTVIEAPEKKNLAWKKADSKQKDKPMSMKGSRAKQNDVEAVRRSERLRAKRM